ncbi:RHS repeat domain-containing protein [Dysgonomonas macrotermitis]|uniref:RHS repeat domain-containing protein n=1 Tax=Dysgonomonas macrotermitis TaxID=1346286 RepID=UPI000781111B|nr:RHS repeat-associated core domain-containing protein [Dysgonomonas macrotermitis]
MYVKEAGSWTVNYIGRDYLGSITHVMDQTGVVRQELSYDPWGRFRNPVDQALYDLNERVTLVLGDRGYTGHEHLSVFGLINMNARLYDPVIGRFLSPDPYVQAPDFSQNFNRYSYALNNPLRYTDPSGEWFGLDDLIAAAIGGTVNLIGNAIAGNVNSWAQGFSYFGVGAGAGLTTLYAGPVVGDMVIAGGNSALQQGFEHGFGNISLEIIGNQMLMGGVTSAISAGVGNLVNGAMNSAFGSIASPVLRQALIQGGTGGVTSFVVAGTMTKINGGSWSDAWSAAKDGLIWGTSIGTAAGSANGYINALKGGVNPWTGKEVITERASTNFLQHNNSGGRNNDLGISQDKVLDNTRKTIMESRSNLKEGDNAINLKINGQAKIIKANVHNGQVRSMNLHSPDTQNPIRPHFNVIQGGDVKW